MSKDIFPISARLGEGFARLSEVLARFGAEMSRGLRGKDMRQVQDIVDRYRASQDSPDKKKKEAWQHIGDMTPAQAAAHWRYLPNPLAHRGRPKGGPVANNVALLSRMSELVGSGKRPTAAARIALQEIDPKSVGLTSRADYLVRVWKKTVK